MQKKNIHPITEMLICIYKFAKIFCLKILRRAVGDGWVRSRRVLKWRKWLVEIIGKACELETLPQS